MVIFSVNNVRFIVEYIPVVGMDLRRCVDNSVIFAGKEVSPSGARGQGEAEGTGCGREE